MNCIHFFTCLIMKRKFKMCLSTNINKAKNHILPLIIKHKVKIDDDIWRSISQRTTSHMCIPVTYNDRYFQRHMSWSLSLHSIVWGVGWLWYRWNCLLKHFSPFSEKKRCILHRLWHCFFFERERFKRFYCYYKPFSPFFMLKYFIWNIKQPSWFV